MSNRDKEIFDLVSHTMFDNIGYDKVTDEQKAAVRLEILKRQLTQNKL